MSVKSRVEELAAWYVANQPAVTQIVVNATPNTLRRHFKKQRGGHFKFGDFDIIPTRKPKKDRAPDPVQESL